MPVDVELGRPEWLLALPALAAVLVLARRPWWRAARARRASTPQAIRSESLRLAVRLGWLAMPVLALAGLAIARPLDRLAVVFVVDRSASVAAVWDHQEAAVGAALARLRDDDVAGVVAAGAGTRIVQPISEQAIFDDLTPPADGTSDLAAGIVLGAGLVPSDRTGRIVLFSDGRETSGDAVAAARDLAARGLTVDVFPIGPHAVADIRLDRVDVPETAREGESTVLRAAVTAGRATDGTLRVYRDDALVVEQTVRFRAGEQEHALALPPASPGMHRLRVEIAAGDPAADATPVNNGLGAVQRVLGAPNVLIIAGDPGAAGFLPAALEAGGARFRVAAPAALPVELGGLAAYDAVVLADVPAIALPVGATELIELYVRELGRGLVMTGGPDAFGPGGYAGTPVEEALPVYMDLRGRGREPRVALVLVIDRSGSMQGLKMEMAKEAAVRSVRLLNAEDQAAVIVFDAYPQWAARLARVGDGAWLEQAVGSIYAGGGTEIFPAVAAAFEALRGTQADVKHLIVLTDGQSASGGAYVDLLEELRDERVTLSTVAVGTDADGALLDALARAGRGRSHVAVDPARLPEVFTEETVMAMRTILVDESFFPAAASASPLLRGVDRVPSLDGYVAVTPKERAEVVLVSQEGDPVLAAWQYGAGRAIAWTPDLGGRWSAGWTRHETAAVLWGNTLSWLLPPPDEGELDARIEHEAGGFTLIAENRTAWDEVRPTTATLVGPAAEQIELDLTPDGPGRYRAPLPELDADAYFIRVDQQLVSGGELRAEAGWAAPYPAEHREIGIDHSTLARIAEAGGGSVLDDATAAVRPPDRPTVSRWHLAPLLIVLAAIGWPLDIASRRLPPPRLLAKLRRRRTATLATTVATPSSMERPGEELGTNEETPTQSGPAPGRPTPPGSPGDAARAPAADRLLEHARTLRQRRRQKS